MSVLRTCIAFGLVLGAGTLSFALSAPGCCTCTTEPAEFELGEYLVVDASVDGPVADGTLVVSEESVVLEYRDADGVSWTATFAPECGNFLLPRCP